MGDLSAEPSMEEILSSIKRIIAEEGDQPARRARPARAAAAPLAPPVAEDEVLELSEPLPGAHRSEPAESSAEEAIAVAPARPPEPPMTEPRMPEPILSSDTAAATRGSLEALSRLMVKPEPGSDGTLEGLVRDMLRPMLREWLDANLPGLVEAVVAREIKRITNA